jgi:hypothetical protein
MKNRDRIIESFESFNKENLDYLILHKKTYVKSLDKSRKSNNILDKIKNYYALDRIKKYDIDRFKYVEKPYGIFVYPDKNFIDLASLIDPSIDGGLFFYITISKGNNQIDFTEGVPEFLRGLSIAYKLYKLVISKVGWVTSDRYSSQYAYNLWYNLLQDKDLYCFTSNVISGLIYKNISDSELIEIINKIKGITNQIEFDDELIEKILILNI